MHRSTVSRRLKQLKARDLVVHVGTAWQRGTGEPEKAAGTGRGKAKRDAQRYEDERAIYRLEVARRDGGATHSADDGMEAEKHHLPWWDPASPIPPTSDKANPRS